MAVKTYNRAQRRRANKNIRKFIGRIRTVENERRQAHGGKKGGAAR